MNRKGKTLIGILIVLGIGVTLGAYSCHVGLLCHTDVEVNWIEVDNIKEWWENGTIETHELYTGNLSFCLSGIRTINESEARNITNWY